MARQRFSDEEDDRDDRPRDRRDDRDDDEDRPRPRRQRDDDEYDDRRGPLKKPGLATAAGVLWVIWGGLGCIMLIFNIIVMMDNGPRRAAAGSTLGNVIAILLLIGGIVICLLAGIRTLNGSVRSIRVFGILSLIYCIGYVVLTTVLVALAAAVLGGVAGAPAGFAVGLVIGACVVTVLIVSGMLLASIFAMSSSKKYELWWQATKGRSRGDY